MSSGVAVQTDCVTTFNEIKLGHKYRYVIYALTKDLKEIEVVKKAAKDASYESFVEDMHLAREDKECRYAVYDAEFNLKDGQQRSKLLFFLWSPDGAKIKQKMVYTSSKTALSKKLVGVHKEIQATDDDELAWDTILEALLKAETAQ